MSAVETEYVLVVPTELFREVGYFQGFSSESGKYLEHLLRPEHTSYRARRDMEEDPSFKQLIPYVVFQWTDASGNLCVFQYTRGSGQGEKRLHQLRSVGIGGHISSIDADVDGSNPYEEGMRRELEEEVIINTPFQGRCVGMINDDETDVGRVHLGVVHIFEVESPEVAPREQELLDTGFRPAEQLLGELDGFESWSQICLKALYG